MHNLGWTRGEGCLLHPHQLYNYDYYSYLYWHWGSMKSASLGGKSWSVWCQFIILSSGSNFSGSLPTNKFKSGPSWLFKKKRNAKLKPPSLKRSSTCVCAHTEEVLWTADIWLSLIIKMSGLTTKAMCSVSLPGCCGQSLRPARIWDKVRVPKTLEWSEPAETWLDGHRWH